MSIVILPKNHDIPAKNWHLYLELLTLDAEWRNEPEFFRLERGCTKKDAPLVRLSLMIFSSGCYLERSVYLLQQHYSCELVGKGHF